MASAEFTIDSTAFATAGYDANNGATVALQLASSTNVRKTVFQVVAQSPGAPNIAELGAPGSAGASPTTPGGILNITMPASGAHTYIIRCQINDGKEIVGDVITFPIAFTKERAIAIRTSGGLRKIAAGEGTQYDTVDGWVEAFGGLIDGGGGQDTEQQHDFPSVGTGDSQQIDLELDQIVVADDSILRLEVDVFAKSGQSNAYTSSTWNVKYDKTSGTLNYRIATNRGVSNQAGSVVSWGVVSNNPRIRYSTSTGHWPLTVRVFSKAINNDST